jgi:hypothetical protein
MHEELGMVHKELEVHACVHAALHKRCCAMGTITRWSP